MSYKNGRYMKLVKDIDKSAAKKPAVSDKEAEEAFKLILRCFYRTWLIIANCYFVFFSLFYCHV